MQRENREETVAPASYNKNKRQIYVWPENKEFFDNLTNKSKFINLLIKKYRQEFEEEDDGREAV